MATEEVCIRNLGKKEIQHRRMISYAGVALSTLTMILTRNQSKYWKLIIALPLLMTYIGHFQANAKVCVVFAAAGVQKLGEKKERVRDEKLQEAIEQKARWVWIKTIAATVGSTALAVYLY